MSKMNIAMSVDPALKARIEAAAKANYIGAGSYCLMIVRAFMDGEVELTLRDAE